MEYLIIFVLLIIFLLYFKGKNDWKNQIKSCLFTLPIQDILPYVLAMAIEKNDDSKFITKDRFFISSMELILMYIASVSREEQNPKDGFRDMLNILSLIKEDKKITSMAYIVYCEMCDSALNSSIDGDYNKFSIDSFSCNIDKLKNTLNSLNYKDYFYNGHIC